MPTIPSTSSMTGGGTTAAAQKTSAMGKDDFLKLMTTQLRRQDPMKPVDDTAFLAQMAQFTSLEQLTNIGTTAAQQLSAEGVSQALALSGRTVTYTDPSGVARTGVVDAVVFDGGVPTLTIGGVKGISPGVVSSVLGTPGAPAASAAPTGADPGPAASTT
jgi:flagellar basal-body rod modification protein FlgD